MISLSNLKAHHLFDRYQVVCYTTQRNLRAKGFLMELKLHPEIVHLFKLIGISNEYVSHDEFTNDIYLKSGVSFTMDLLTVEHRMLSVNWWLLEGGRVKINEHYEVLMYNKVYDINTLVCYSLSVIDLKGERVGHIAIEKDFNHVRVNIF